MQTWHFTLAGLDSLPSVLRTSVFPLYSCPWWLQSLLSFYHLTILLSSDMKSLCHWSKESDDSKNPGINQPLLIVYCILVLWASPSAQQKAVHEVKVVEETRVLRKVTSQGDLIVNAHLRGLWYIVTPQAYHFFTKRFPFAPSELRPLFPCIWVNKDLKCPLWSPSFDYLTSFSDASFGSMQELIPLSSCSPTSCDLPYVPSLISNA